jgi:hypothetical protein
MALEKFFIVGTPRSGTTLLQAMLMRAPGVCIPPETKFLRITWHKRSRFGDIRRDAGWKRVTSAVKRSALDNEIPLALEYFDELVAEVPRTYGALFSALLEAIAHHENAAWIGEKSPAHARYVELLFQMFPESRAVQIVRDPRDVAASQLEAFGASPLQAALRWRRDASNLLKYRSTYPPDRYTYVRYEDLVQDPRQQLEDLSKFLGIPFVSQMLEPHRRSRMGFASRETHKERTLLPVTTSRVGRSGEVLLPGDRALVELICRRGMRELGYALGKRKYCRAMARGMRQLPSLIMSHIVRVVSDRRKSRQEVNPAGGQ